MSKRDQILAAALKLFIRQGFEKTPTSAISKAAGVATGTLFHHFKTKEDLINAIYYDVKTEMHTVLCSHSIKGVDVRVDLEMVWTNVMAWMLSNPEKYRFLSQFGESALIESTTRERVEELFTDIQALLKSAIKQGLFAELPLPLMNCLMASHMFTMASYLLQNPELWENEPTRQMLFKSFWLQMATR